jgi:regulator of sigma E protease
MLLIIIVILLFASLVIIHEWGHFVAARRDGVVVEEFGVGFPPKAWGKKIKGTLYTLNWLPLGGFVRLKGEDGVDNGPGSFNAARFSTKVKILVAGVVMNFLTAVVILYALAVTGLPGLGGFEPSFLNPSYAQPKQLVVVNAAPDSPADQAGIKRGDFILSVDGRKMETEDDLRTYTKSHAGEKVSVKVKSGEAERTVNVQLREPNSTAGFLGVASQQVYKLKYDPLSALVAAVWISGALFVATVWGVIKLLAGVPTLLVGLFSTAVPAVAQEASGPVGIIYIFNAVSSLGPSYIFLFMANIAVALAAFNILPLPALDGGRLALIVWQKVTGRIISPDREAQIHGIGFMVLIGLILVISIYDLRKFF